MAEYVAIVVQCLLIATLFLGGWQLIPWIDTHAVLSRPENASLALRIILTLILVAGGLVGWKLLKWHRHNRLKWHDARRNEGLVLAMLFGFLPAATAGIVLLLWGGTLGFNGTAVAAGAVEMLALVSKTLLLAWVFVWIRWTVPRFRYDQLMGLGWKIMLPLGMANLMVTALLVQMGVL